MSLRMVADHAGDPGALRCVDLPAAPPGRGQVLVLAQAAGVGPDDLVPGPRRRWPRGAPTRPATPGRDVVGVVTAVGRQVSAVAVGDRVAAWTPAGGYAAEVVVPAARIVRVPAAVSAAQAAALVRDYVTAWQMLHRHATVPRGGSVLVLDAANGVGSALVELALLKRLAVLATAPAAAHVSLQARGVQLLAGPHEVSAPVDAAFVGCAGSALGASRAVTRRGGVVVIYAGGRLGRRGRAGARLASGALRPRSGGDRVARVAAFALTDGPVADFRADLSALLALLVRRQLDPVVNTLPLTAAADAHRRLRTGQVLGSMVLLPA